MPKSTKNNSKPCDLSKSKANLTASFSVKSSEHSDHFSLLEDLFESVEILADSKARNANEVIKKISKIGKSLAMDYADRADFDSEYYESNVKAEAQGVAL